MQLEEKGVWRKCGEGETRLDFRNFGFGARPTHLTGSRRKKKRDELKNPTLIEETSEDLPCCP